MNLYQNEKINKKLNKQKTIFDTKKCYKNCGKSNKNLENYVLQ